MYQSFYNLTGKPFRLSPDPAFFFPSRGHKRALAYLRYGLHQNEGFVVITGAPGTGKTTLAQILLDEMGEKNIVVAHLTTTQLEADDMLRMVAASFGLRYENLDKAALLKTIESFLLARSREGKRALLVIDEAQNLPARSLEELRMLSNLQVGDKALLQTFMLGQVQFRNMLDNPDLEQLRQRVIANFHLSPLAADESQRYIESRLKHVNWKNDPHFAEIAFEKIHEYTEGVPRRINMLCDRILLFACMEETHNVTGELVDLVKKELEHEVSGVTAKTQTQVTHETRHASELEKPASSKEPAYNAKASLNAASQLAEELKSVTQKVLHKNIGEEFKVAEHKAVEPKVSELKATEPKAAESRAKQFASEAPEISSARLKDAKRAEPKLPDTFDTYDEDFIDITEDFINAFDKNMSISEDANEKREKSLLNTPAKTGEKQQSAKSKSTQTIADQGNKQDSKRDNKHDKKNKPGVKAEKEAKDKPVIAKDPEQETAEQDVLGNTVKHKKPAAVETEVDAAAINLTPEPPPQISERDLFRVIPGGKNGVNKDNSESPGRTSKVAIPPAAQAAPSTEDVVLRRILRLVLAFHRSPSSFPGLDDPTQPLPEGVSELLELSVSDDQVLTKVSPAAVMGISPVMLRAAVRFFVRRTLFASKGDYYRILGLQPNAAAADIERHYDLLMRLLRQDKQPGAAECVDRVGRAYEELMRLDDAPAKTANKFQEPEDRAAAVLEALENPELTIDFSEEIKPKEQARPLSAYIGASKDGYLPDPRIARRRIHLLGQAAILGIGALVVVLGIFITQLEPSESLESKPAGAVANTIATNPIAAN
ncbi:MAG: XrtA-associated ATPase, partial [Gammaproteobacteria bacterium]|nr:XrtA-associated ATPase [Gammaproteobacteria bacterium]